MNDEEQKRREREAQEQARELLTKPVEVVALWRWALADDDY